MTAEQEATAFGPAPSDNGSGVVFCTDSRYARHLGVALFSLLVNNAARGIPIWVICDDLSGEHLSRLKTLAETFNTSIRIIRVRDERIEGLGGVGHITSASYYRLLIPGLLPDDCGRVLYLDCDLVVDGTLDSLWSTELGDRAVGACPDPVVQFLRRAANGTVEGAAYFNSGVLLLDLERWRRTGIAERALDHAQSAAGKLRYADQDALNAVVRGEFQPLEARWNFFAFSRLRPDIARSVNQLQAGCEEPSIVHFAGSVKPWHAWCDHPLKELHDRYRKVSPWRVPDPVEPPPALRECLWAAEVAAAEGRTADLASYLRLASRMAAG
jgi:lipopolysaccharide biosynthesis glycosyltransferase